MMDMMDSDMMWGDLGGLIAVILVVLILAAFVHTFSVEKRLHGSFHG